MGTQFVPEADPMEFMRHLTQWHRVEVVRNPAGDYRRAMDTLILNLTNLVPGRFMVSLDREDEMTDSMAYFSVRCEHRPDAEIVAAHYPFTVLYAAPEPREDPGPAPDWLYKFAAKS